MVEQFLISPEQHSVWRGHFHVDVAGDRVEVPLILEQGVDAILVQLKRIRIRRLKEDDSRSCLETQACITIKDHKENYQNDTKCRLINPTKPELGKISKQKLAKIVEKVKAVTKVNQWRNTDSVLAWFKELPNKNRLNFISFDIVSFYPSISEDLLRKAI